MVHGVGILGAGPGSAALHVPTLARFAEHLRVVHIADSGSGRAAVLADQLGARSSAGVEHLLADPAVEIVAICTPPAQHAAQILACVAAGKRAILCEKPLAETSDDAIAVVEACRNAGVALIVGTNHYFDAALGRAKFHLAEHGGRADSITVVAALPPNGRYHEAVTEPEPERSQGLVRAAPDLSDGRVAGAILRTLVLGLAMHDLPAVRDLAPRLDSVVYARPIPPVGYTLGFVADGVRVQLTAAMLPPGADALWRMSITNGGDRIDIEFAPAFVHGGSAEVIVRFSDGRIVQYPPPETDGYIEEWRALLEVIDGDAPAELDEILADALYAITLADAVVGSMQESPDE